MRRVIKVLLFAIISKRVLTKKNYSLAYFYPEGADDLLRAAEIAVTKINANTSVLQGIQLNLDAVATTCTQRSGLRSALDIYKQGETLAFVGGFCGKSTRGIAYVSMQYNVPQMAVSTVENEFSDKQEYPLLSRAVPGNAKVANVIQLVFAALNYTHIGIIYHTDAIDLFNVLTANDQVQIDYIGAIRNGEKNHIGYELDQLATVVPDTRIILLLSLDENIYLDLQQHICADEDKKNFFDTYVFIFILGAAETYREETFCSRGNFIFILPTEWAQRNAAFEQLFNDTNYDDRAPLVYDSIWITALAIHSSASLFDEQAINYQLRHLSFSEALSGKWLLNDKDGDRIAYFDIYLRLSNDVTFYHLFSYDGTQKALSLSQTNLSLVPSNAWPPRVPQVETYLDETTYFWSWSTRDQRGFALTKVHIQVIHGMDTFEFSVDPKNSKYSAPIPSEIRAKNLNDFIRVVCISVAYQTVGGRSAWSDSSCQPCQSGWYLDTNDTSQNKTSICRPCPQGTYEDEGTCKKCEQGTYNDIIAATQCTYCASDEYQPDKGSASCYSCPKNSERFTFAELTTLELFQTQNLLTDCVCLPGYYTTSNTTGVHCHECPRGGKCAGGTAVPIPKTNWWGRRNQASPKFYECGTKRCLGNFRCRWGFTGRLCANVVRGKAYLIGNRRVRCPSSGINRILLTVTYLLVLFLLWILVNHYICQDYAVLDASLRLFQVAAIFFDNVKVNWPKSFDNFPRLLLNFLLFDVDFITVNCIYSYREHDKLFFSIYLINNFFYLVFDAIIP
mmetsp:Transcript_13759/g.20539  ORF Transcript_13759/g.20539 Transcript_13759/m.20539 type:complete len:788 (-) Transcript_13759:3154-5517(-)